MLTKNMKTIVFWLISLPLFYTLCGFVILPWWIRTQLPSLLHEKVGILINVEHVRFNPFTFEVNLESLALLDSNAAKALSIGHIYLNYDPSALFKKEFSIKAVHIDNPDIDLSLDQEGSLKLLKLFPNTQTQEQENNASETTTSLTMPLIVKHVEIHNAHTLFQDPRGEHPFQFEIGPISYTADNLSFYKDDLSLHAIKAVLQNEEKLSIASSLIIEPLIFYGELNLTKLPLSTLWGYTLSALPIRLSNGDLTLRIPFWIDLSKSSPSVLIEKGSLLVENTEFTDANQSVIHIPSLKLDGIDFDLQASHVNIAEASLTQPNIHLQLEKAYRVNFERLFTPASKTNPASDNTVASSSSATPSPWSFSLRRLYVDSARVHVVDQNVKSSPIDCAPLSLIVDNITNDTNQTVAFDLNGTIDQDASLKLKGTFLPARSSLDMRVVADTLSLEKVQPYLKPFTTVLIQDGYVSLDTLLKASFDRQTKFDVQGDITVSKFSLADRFKTPLVAWESLNLSALSYTLDPEVLRIQKIALDKPYVNLDIKKDHSTNFADLLVQQKAPPTTTHDQKSVSKESALTLFLGNISLKRGTAHFQDASLPIPFATFADNLNGSLSTLDTKSTKPSTLKIEGKVDKYGYAKIDSTLLPFDIKNHANLKIIFKNIAMPKLTPYSGKFVGYAIKEGKLSLDLNYKIKKGLMEGQNKINLDSLVLGEKIESEDALNLPLDLAIALLKDSKGQIDLDLPVSGDLNDPEFRYGSVVWKALGNLIGGIVTSPFKLLGSLLGIEAENLQSIDFAAGEAVLIASEEEKMAQYRQILEKRSALKLLITPSYNETLDMQALKENNITAQIEQKLSKNSTEDAYARAVQKLFIQKYGDVAYGTLMKQYKEEQLDPPAINDRLITKIAETVVIDPAVLHTLAQKRAEAIVQKLTNSYNIAPERLIKQEAQAVDAQRESWVGCAISISN